MSEETLRSQILTELRSMNAKLDLIGQYLQPTVSYRSITDPSTLTQEQRDRLTRMQREWDEDIVGTHDHEADAQHEHIRSNPISTGVPVYNSMG